MSRNTDRLSTKTTRSQNKTVIHCPGEKSNRSSRCGAETRSVGAPQPDDQDNTPHLGCTDSKEKTKITNQNSHSLACNPRLAPAAMLFSLLLWHSSSDASQLAVGLQPHGVWLSKSTSHRSLFFPHQRMRHLTCCQIVEDGRMVSKGLFEISK